MKGYALIIIMAGAGAGASRNVFHLSSCLTFMKKPLEAWPTSVNYNKSMVIKKSKSNQLLYVQVCVKLKYKTWDVAKYSHYFSHLNH